MTSITFLGAAGTVTGSRHLVEHRGKRILLDCGLFQGRKSLRQRNWEPFGVNPSTIDVVILSHAHIDHTGYLPRLVKQGFRGPIFTTPATRDLLAIMLPDSGRIQEEDAKYANKKGFSKHAPAEPLYSEADAAACIPMMRAVPYKAPQEILEGVNLTMHRAGHILGSAVVELTLSDGHRIVFSGDLGRYDTPIVCDPEPVAGGTETSLLVECTYGDRRHDQHDPVADLAEEAMHTAQNGGALIIPAFAIGRTQHILYLLAQLQREDKLPPLPIFVDSPMACDATPLFLMHREEHDEDMTNLVLAGEVPIHPKTVHFCRSREQSMAINEVKEPCIIISASGMATGGRVLHHLKRRLPDESTKVLFVGYQAHGSRGRRLLNGEKSIKIHGQMIDVRAKIGQIYGFSGHGDYAEIQRWLRDMEAPARTFCVHGESDGLKGMATRLRRNGWNVHIPTYQETVTLD